ncbi:hypothetical protein LIA77_09543 [Sarocladium implicatum]|nr:hypothetical protein LIA77_09543 [Sarocladium implicatum]
MATVFTSPLSLQLLSQISLRKLPASSPPLMDLMAPNGSTPESTGPGRATSRWWHSWKDTPYWPWFCWGHEYGRVARREDTTVESGLSGHWWQTHDDLAIDGNGVAAVDLRTFSDPKRRCMKHHYLPLRTKLITRPISAR